MSAKRLAITDRDRQSVGVFASLADFTWSEEGAFDADTMLENPNISLYSLDIEHEWALFVMLPDEVNLADAPFVYQAQFDRAQYLIALPYDEFLRLSDKIPTTTDQLICVHNIGRCGSTLMNQAFNQIDGVMALSEPDVFACFLKMRDYPQQQLEHLVQASYKFLFRPSIVGNANRFVIKFRNQNTETMGLFNDSFPGAKHLFMYRNVMDWLASWYRLRTKYDGIFPDKLSRSEAITWVSLVTDLPSEKLESLFDPSIEIYSGMTFLAVAWAMMLNRYLYMIEAGFQSIAIRYDELSAAPQAILTQLVHDVDLPETVVQSMLTAFERDSQAGTDLARDNKSGNTVQLPDEDVEAVQVILSKQPIVNHPDYMLPNTLRFEE